MVWSTINQIGYDNDHSRMNRPNDFAREHFFGLKLFFSEMRIVFARFQRRNSRLEIASAIAGNLGCVNLGLRTRDQRCAIWPITMLRTSVWLILDGQAWVYVNKIRYMMEIAAHYLSLWNNDYVIRWLFTDHSLRGDRAENGDRALYVIGIVIGEIKISF